MNLRTDPSSEDSTYSGIETLGIDTNYGYLSSWQVIATLQNSISKMNEPADDLSLLTGFIGVKHWHRYGTDTTFKVSRS